MRHPDGRLLHRFRDGEAGIPAFADDYAFLSWGLLELYGATFDPCWLQGGSKSHRCTSRPLLGRGRWRLLPDCRRCVGETGQPGGNRSPTECCPRRTLRRSCVLTRLAEITGKAEYRRKAEQVAGLYPGDAEAASISFGAFFSALDLLVGAVIRGRYCRRPCRCRHEVHAARAEQALPPPGHRDPAAERPPWTHPSPGLRRSRRRRSLSAAGRLAHVCEAGSCRLPTTDVSVMLAHLGEE